MRRQLQRVFEPHAQRRGERRRTGGSHDAEFVQKRRQVLLKIGQGDRPSEQHRQRDGGELYDIVARVYTCESAVIRERQQAELAPHRSGRKPQALERRAEWVLDEAQAPLGCEHGCDRRSTHHARPPDRMNATPPVPV